MNGSLLRLLLFKQSPAVDAFFLSSSPMGDYGWVIMHG